MSKKFSLFKAFEGFDFTDFLGTASNVASIATGFIKKGAQGIATVKEESPIDYLDYSVDAPKLRLPTTNAPLKNQPMPRFNDPRLATALRKYVQNSTNRDFRDFMMRYSNVQPTIRSGRKTIPVQRAAVNVRKSTKTLPSVTTKV